MAFKISDIEKIFKSTPTKISGELNGEPIDVTSLKSGFAGLQGYATTFLVGRNSVKHEIKVGLMNGAPMLYFDNEPTRAPAKGKIYDIDIHLFKVVVEFRWKDYQTGNENLLRLRVAKNPFAGLFG